MRNSLPAMVVLFGSLALCAAANAQTGIISTYAGPSAPVDGSPATSAALYLPGAVATDGAGGFYVVSQSRVYHVTSGGVMTRVAGTSRGYSGDGGPAVLAQLSYPVGIVADASGNIFIADSGNHRIRKVSPSGVITTIAGTGVAGFAGDGGPAASAQFSGPGDLAIDTSSNLFVADGLRVRKITSEGVISTVAGSGAHGSSGDNGPAVEAAFESVFGLAVDGSGNIYIADTFNDRVRKVTPDGMISTVAGSSGTGNILVELRDPYDVAVDGSGNLYILDSSFYCIRKVSPGGTVSTFAGSPPYSFGFSGDGGPATAARISFAWGLAADSSGDLYIADSNNNRVRKVSGGIITTVAGSGISGFQGDGGPATAAKLDYPAGPATDGAGNLYFADSNNNRVRKVSPGGVISTVAGTGDHGFSGDGGAAISARLANPLGVAVDGVGNLYIVEINDRIRKVSPDGVITTVAGTGEIGFNGDGQAATSAQLFHPNGVAVDASGNLYIADTYNHRIRKVTTSGIISTVAGTGDSGFGGDEGPGAAAQLQWPSAVAVDRSGNVYIADVGNHRIRKVSPEGIISTFAGTGTPGFSGDGGPATLAELTTPSGVAVDSSGILYIAANGRIRKVFDGTISTVAGGNVGLIEDGVPAQSASIGPEGVAVDALGNLFIAESEDHRIRKITMGLPTAFEPSTLARGDFDGDGRSDILWQRSDGSVALWLMDGSIPSGSGPLMGGFTGWNTRKIADFNGDGKSDILWQHTDGSTILTLMDGLTVIGATSALVDPTSGWVVRDVGDFNGDGRTDIVWQHIDGSSALWLMNGVDAMGASGLIGPGTDWSVRHVGDFNGDGKADLLWRHADGSATIWLMDGGSPISAAGLTGPGTDWSVRHVGDFNGDGKSDLLWRHADGSAAIWLMDGGSPISAAGLIGPDTGWSVRDVGDFNGDGKTDLVWRHTDGSAAIWL
ncbi:MAG TPA: FG-GAP-like repeat-containing protein, partial [Terriglobia bacterium]|nr:FG-GAP-like repeat-containing protein [Terriglobia bacterium]